MKKTIILFILVFIFSLGCSEYVYRTWFIDIENKLSYPIKVESIFISDNKTAIRIIPPNEIRAVWTHSTEEKRPAAHKRIRRIYVYRESDDVLIMILEGTIINNHVIYMGESIYGVNDCWFLFQIREEDVGIGLDKGIDFKEELEKKTESEIEEEFYEEIESELEYIEVEIEELIEDSLM